VRKARFSLGAAHLLARSFDEAIAAFEDTRSLAAPDVHGATQWSGLLGRLAEAHLGRGAHLRETPARGPLSIGERDNQTARNEIGSRAAARKSERPQSTVSDSRRKSRKRRVISNVVREELERAPANLRPSILEGIRGLELDWSRRISRAEGFSQSMNRRGSFRLAIETTCATWRSPRSPAQMRWYRGTSNIW
jgi:hypothetical protein